MGALTCTAATITGKVLIGGEDANLEQIKRGMAWHYKAYERVIHALVLCVLAGSVWAKGFDTEGIVVFVQDGDTVTLLAASKQLDIRLSSIDAPETTHTKKETGRIGQPYSNNSKQFLAGLVKGKQVRAQCFEYDVHQRAVCELFLEGMSVNDQMVAAGWAWANMSAGGRYLRNKALPGIEAAARASGIGLWAGAHPVAPWFWRKNCWQNGICS